MPTLSSPSSAAALWGAAVPLSPTQQEFLRDGENPTYCYGRDSFVGVCWAGYSPAYIGTDQASGIAYFHLDHLSSRWNHFRENYSHTFECPGGNPNCSVWNQYFSYNDEDNWAIYDAVNGQSAINPQTSMPWYPHAGYPVAAGIDIGGGNYLPIAAGDAAALTVADAQYACWGTSVPSIPIAGMPDDLVINVYDDSEAGYVP